MMFSKQGNAIKIRSKVDEAILDLSPDPVGARWAEDTFCGISAKNKAEHCGKSVMSKVMIVYGKMRYSYATDTILHLRNSLM